MKRIATFLSVLALAALLGACNQKQEVKYSITADRAAILEVAANNPDPEVILIETDAPYWIVTTSDDWISVDPVTAPGGGKSTIVTVNILPNYKNESTTTNPRSGEIKFSGGMTSLIVPVSQLGHQASVDPSASIGGIPDMDEFMDFVNAVNEGAALDRWRNDAGEVALLTDIDLNEFTSWTPIGNVKKSGNGNNASKAEGNTFSDIFNGNNFTIKNFKVVQELEANETWGLFGYLENATVKNLKVEADVVLSAKGVSDAGIVAGTAYCSTIENVHVTGKIKSTGTSATTRFAIGGIAGFLFSVYNTGEGVAYDTFVTDCSVDMTVEAVGGANLANGAGCAMYGGIAAFATNVKDKSQIHITNCTNSGSMTVTLGRCSGILATANYGTIITGCTNNASQVNDITNGRIGQIVCNLSVNSKISDCQNNGNLTTTGASTTTAAIVALVADDSAVVEGGERIANTGTILGCTPKYLGLIVANTTKTGGIKDFILSGRIGVYKADGNHEMYDVTAANVMDYIGCVADAYKEKVTNITYVAPNE